MSISQNYPTVRPQLLIDIANTEVLDPRVASSRASVATYYDENGVLQTAPANVARVGYDPVTGACTGLIREAQGTNLVTYSEDFADAAWGKLNSTVSSNIAVAPDGTLTMDALIPNVGASSGRVSRALSQTGVITVSIYAKAYGAITGFRLGSLGNGGFQNFNLSTGLLGVGTVTSADMFYLGDGLYRCSATWNQTVANTLFMDTSGFGTGNGFDGIYIWGAQLETGLQATSYIKTEASQVTRAADSFLLTNVGEYNTAEFTAISEPFGVAGVSSGTVTLNGDVPIERLYVYPNNIAQDQINSVVGNDGWWSWRIVGATFALPSFVTDGSIQVDWGDGTVETLTTAVHTFTNASPHTVKFRQMTGTYFRPRIYANATYAPMVVGVGSAPSNMIIDCNSVFYGCTNLKSLDATFVGLSSFCLLYTSPSPRDS